MKLLSDLIGNAEFNKIGNFTHRKCSRGVYLEINKKVWEPVVYAVRDEVWHYAYNYGFNTPN